MDRRGFIKAGLGAAAMLPVVGAVFAARTAFAEPQLATEVPAAKALVDALQYRNQSDKPDQHCSNCMQFTAQGEGRGTCALIPVPDAQVSENGWCLSWVAKPATG